VAAAADSGGRALGPDDAAARTALTSAAPAPADAASPGGVDALRRPDAYPPPAPTRVELVTTHISWVFLTDHDVWKLKRPVDYGFLDYTTLERRRHACEEEVRLNERLAPGVYLGVVPVRRGPAGHTLTGDGPVVDYAVHMRRLADTASADAMLRAGALGHDHLWLVASVLARFYVAAAATPRYGSVGAIEANLTENFEQARPFVGRSSARPRSTPSARGRSGSSPATRTASQPVSIGAASGKATATSASSTSTSRTGAR
jgi:hypothetical protein